MKLWGPFETHPKAIPWTCQIAFYVVSGLQVWCQDIHDQALNQLLYHFHPFRVGPSTQGKISTVSGSSNFVLDPPLWGELGAISNRPWNSIHCMPCGTPCRIYIHSNSLGSWSPQAKCKVKCDGPSIFKPMEDIKFLWSRALKVEHKVPLKETILLVEIIIQSDAWSAPKTCPG